MAMRSRWISLVPPPKVRMMIERACISSRPAMTAAGEPRVRYAGLADDLHQGADGPQVELRAEDLDRRRVSDVELPLRRLPRHLPVDEA